MIMASEQGGMNIEEVAKHNPDAIIWQPIDILQGNITMSLMCYIVISQYECNM